jgi:two-component system, NarL family, invasion response regulator UvrY
MPPRILIVDDHQIVRQGVRSLLAEFRPDWQICGEAENANEALEAIRNLSPDLTVLDITMPGSSGLELAAQVRTSGLAGHILIFTMHESQRLGVDVRATGAQGYVLKSQAAHDLVFAIERILAGGTFYGNETEGGSEREPDPNRNMSFRVRLAFAGI